MSEIAVQYQKVCENVAQVCERVGRNPDSVTVLPVSKTFDSSIVKQAIGAGLTRFGENKVQELKQKASDLGAFDDLRWVLIGHLQTNKAKEVARYAHELQSLDRLELAEILDRRLQLEGRSLEVLIQVKTSSEESKTGMLPEDVTAFAKSLKFFDTLRLKGFMTVAENTESQDEVRACFATLRQLRDKVQNELSLELPVLSMGMSSDYEIAIEEGSTEIRIGTAIFGQRDYKK